MGHGINYWFFYTILILSLCSLVAVILRCVGRWKRRSFLLDDWMMVMAELLFIPTVICVLLSTLQGLGTRDRYLTPANIIKATMYFSIFDLLYCITLAVLKLSLCLTLLRFAVDRALRLTIYAVIIMNTITTAVVIAAVFSVCRPYSTNWRYFYDFPEYPKEGKCFDIQVILTLIYTLTGIVFVTDLVCVIIPAIIFWNSPMKRAKKIMAWALLSLGLVASIATLCRVPFVTYWDAKEDRMWGLGMGVLRCCVEISLGIIAGCAPAMRPLVAAVFTGLKTQVSCYKPSQATESIEMLPSPRPTRLREADSLAALTFDNKVFKPEKGVKIAVVEHGSHGSSSSQDFDLEDYRPV